MSITATHLLEIAEAINNKVANCVDFAIPSPLRYADKASFWNAYDDANNTKTEIETALIHACWSRYKTFELSAGEDEDALSIDNPIVDLIYELTLLTESKQTRLDETVTPDVFNKQIKETNHDHVTAIMALCAEFQGASPLAELLATFAVAETLSLVQVDATEETIGEYVPVIGDQTKLECRIRIQLPC